MQPVANIAVWNAATTPIEFDLTNFVKAAQIYVDNVLVPVWGRPAVLTLSDKPISGQWGMVFMDNADEPGALAYHTVEDGLPLAKVFVKTILANGETISGGASHELAEMLVDPLCYLMVAHPGGGYYALECCDPVEESTFDIDGFQMSDIVFPRYFEPLVDDGIQHQYSWMRTVTKPYELAPGGYQSIYLNGQWTEIFGSREKMQRFALEDRRGHRSEYRRACAPS